MATVKQLSYPHTLYVVQTAYTQARQWQLSGCTHVTQDETCTYQQLWRTILLSPIVTVMGG